MYLFIHMCTASSYCSPCHAYIILSILMIAIYRNNIYLRGCFSHVRLSFIRVDELTDIYIYIHIRAPVCVFLARGRASVGEGRRSADGEEGEEDGEEGEEGQEDEEGEEGEEVY